MSKRSRFESGFNLIEIVFLIVLLAIVAGVGASIFGTAIAGSADPMIRKQATAVAEGFLEEILSSSAQSQPWTGAATQANRLNFDDMFDYNGYTSTGIYDRSGAAIASLAAFNVSVSVTASPAELAAALPAVPAIPAADTTRIRVTVTGPSLAGVPVSMTIDTYAFKY